MGKQNPSLVMLELRNLIGLSGGPGGNEFLLSHVRVWQCAILFI